ncbi:hypothetical protein Golob_027488 [Gossypium lobatum]|uniref:Uncharacterized protein n=1 Tax=Gossypium lobatum TaxID=34289 RepID=A0A7J8NKK0_9ROSI|nr:hypothetical protein [Gossypium lobatum]
MVLNMMLIGGCLLHCSHGPGGDYRFYALESPTYTCSLWWKHGPSYVGLLEELEDFRLLLDQCSKAKFEWMLYANTDIISCIPPEMLANREMWNANVPLVMYAMVEMHE